MLKNDQTLCFIIIQEDFMTYDFMTVKYAFKERGFYLCDKRFTCENKKTRNRRLDLPNHFSLHYKFT